MTSKRSSNEIKQAVKQHYGTAITQKQTCCGTSTDFDPEAAVRFVQLAGYSDDQIKDMPEGVTSFGCGNPVNFIDVKQGDVVLDLGSGAGLDLILAAGKVGPRGKVIGLDMTPEMIETCKSNLKKAGIRNAEILLGEMENMPISDNMVDCIISNCVINLSPEKESVFAEAFRVLRPGGRMLVSDIVTLNLPESYRDDITAWVGCIAGAVEEKEYIELVRQAGFSEVEIVDKMIYNFETLRTLSGDACGCGSEYGNISQNVIDKYADRVASVKLSARKPK